MSETMLKPCPFCGGEAELSVGKTGDGKDWHYIECNDCGTTGPNVKYADHNIRVKEANAEAWNRRSVKVIEPTWWIVQTDMGKVIFHGSDKERADRVALIHLRQAEPLYSADALLHIQQDPE